MYFKNYFEIHHQVFSASYSSFQFPYNKTECQTIKVNQGFDIKKDWKLIKLDGQNICMQISTI